MPVSTTRELLIVDLRTYGEDAVAEAVASAAEERLSQVFDRADHYLYADEFATPSGASPLLAEALARAAVEIIEGRRARCAGSVANRKGSIPAASAGRRRASNRRHASW